MQKIKLGYEIGTGRQVDISLSHLIVCGVTQLSGKTTTLEALIKRSGKRAVVFRTKIGEKSFIEGSVIPGFFRDRSDYEFVRSLIEAYSSEKLFVEKGTLMRLCKDFTTLEQIQKGVDDKIATGKLRGLNEEIYTRLQHYLGNLIPQIKNARLSTILALKDGINIMNLEKFGEPVQSLIIQSTLDEVLTHMKDIIVVIPEAWKFIPQKYSNPCKRSVESFIRQGAASGNYIWIDSQDMAGVDKTPLKQISTWILGFQLERNEVKHTLDQIALPPKSKPAVEEIMNLRVGQFILSSYEGVKKVYVQPAWIDDDAAIAVAKGVKKIESIEVPKPKEVVQEEEDVYDDTEIREKLCYIENRLTELEKRPSGGGQTFVVAPLEKIRKSFLEEAKQHILGEIEKLDAEQKKILKFVEVQGKGCKIPDILDHCLHRSATSGGNRQAVSTKVAEMGGLIRKDRNGIIYPCLKDHVRTYLAPHGAADGEIQQVYDHVLAGMLG
jgi:hypothetical protein